MAGMDKMVVLETTELGRIAKAMESIADSLVRLANPPMIVTTKEDGTQEFKPFHEPSVQNFPIHRTKLTPP